MNKRVSIKDLKGSELIQNSRNQNITRKDKKYYFPRFVTLKNVPGSTLYVYSGYQVRNENGETITAWVQKRFQIQTKEIDLKNDLRFDFKKADD